VNRNNYYSFLELRVRGYYTMTQLTYRGAKYFKEEEGLRNRNWWNLAHRPNLWLRYRGLQYRPIQTGGLL
jgi:glutamate/tyrosine decarboxylase-like PLP-dependent enzyme